MRSRSGWVSVSCIADQLSERPQFVRGVSTPMRWSVTHEHHRGASLLHSCSPQIFSTTLKHATCRRSDDSAVVCRMRGWAGVAGQAGTGWICGVVQQEPSATKVVHMNSSLNWRTNTDAEYKNGMSRSSDPSLYATRFYRSSKILWWQVFFYLLCFGPTAKQHRSQGWQQDQWT